ncbi:IS1182 family transposase [Alicyclobacillus cycloheptanicus]|jgi:transposase|uniref:Transposase n=1 Tax=Alicyclobacillus cycloheptanicus TaxID=1457 RepID=A0ABT9XMV3_9BACL|nr:IS1182 family transposase [Alicyclobacillus cycloheptanicus]MDQ0191651.1 transposase [Alicyclobacillus cycloheptanicus]WDM01278.1 IS1182 family transposase [Alicyclobacillus cycloheptanicus]WDM02141.1 IS1182 family transposase [Alicyclobacillus cycloheptanicus]WDM02341.1 IS1182 family transposase [Alicyclobacillus cycloheptanicus]
MTKKFRPYDPNQIMLLPPSLDEWLPEDHLVHFIDDIVDSLDISAILSVYERELRGFPPYHPAMLLKVLIYAYSTGTYSSRKIAKACQENVAYRMLSANQFPDFRTISDFRKRHLAAFENLFLQVLHICSESGMVKLGHIALDGTKIKANASKHKAMSYGRMKQDSEKLRKEIRDLLRQVEHVDEREDRRYGSTRGDELPVELTRRETRLKKIQEAMATLEKRAKEQAEQESKDNKDDPDGKGPGGKRRGRPRKQPKDLPADKAQMNFTDPESRIMKTANGFIQGYNVQSVVDEAYQIIVATKVTNSPADAGHLRDMMRMVEENMSKKPKRLSCDAGYFKQDDITWLESEGIDPYIATGRQPHNTMPITVRGRIPSHYGVKERMARKLKTKKGHAIYARRKVIVEPPHGQIKHCRKFDHFSLRGLAKVEGEWSLVAMCHNLLKLFRYGTPKWATV